MKIKIITIAVMGLLMVIVTACDLTHQERCEWYLMPNPDPEWIAKVDEGYIPVCARNLVINRENCDLQATLEFAEGNYGKKFRYVDIEIDTSGKFPRKVSGIAECSSEESLPIWKKWQRTIDDWIVSKSPQS